MKTQRMFRGAILSLLLASSVGASDPGAPTKGSGDVSKGFPKAVVKDDKPKTDPHGVLVLNTDTLYVADFDEEGALLVFPEGLVKITNEPGPMRIKAKFADGNGSIETRTYSGKHIYTLEIADAKKPVSGRVTAAFVPFGFKSENQIKKTLIDVLHSPLPPPKPKPPDPVIPDPVIPDPIIPTPDAALVAKFKNALATDIAANQGTKEKAAALAVVFDSGAALLDLNDPAIAPKTVGELATKMINASVAKGIPRPPYLKNVRDVIGANTPIKNGMTELTPELKAEYQAAYRLVAAALTEASK